MALQPIDLQTMYSQMANVAQRVSGETQGASLSQQNQQQGIVNQNLRQSQSVQRAAENQSEAGKIKKDGSGNSQNAEAQEKKGGRQETEESEKREYEIRDPLLGQRVNLVG